MAMFDRIRKIRSDQRGVAAIEFALWASLIGLPLIGGADFALYSMSKLRLNNALGQGVIAAFQTREAVNVTTTRNIVTASWGNTPAVTVTVTCNGTASCVNTNRPCARITGWSAGAPQFTAVACNSGCVGNSCPGYFMTIRGEATYSSIINNGRFTAPTQLDQSVTVALQ